MFQGSVCIQPTYVCKCLSPFVLTALREMVGETGRIQCVTETFYMYIMCLYADMLRPLIRELRAFIFRIHVLFKNTFLVYFGSCRTDLKLLYGSDFSELLLHC